MPTNQRLELIVYADFNCPFSALASARAGDLERAALAEVDWRAVEHAPDIPLDGCPLEGEARDALGREVEEVLDLLTDRERHLDRSRQLVLPAVHSNTALATFAFAAVPVPERPALRQRLFDAYWRSGANLSDPATLAGLGAEGADQPLAARWREEWLALPQTVVPSIVLPDGEVALGVDALALLVKLAG